MRLRICWALFSSRLSELLRSRICHKLAEGQEQRIVEVVRIRNIGRAILIDLGNNVVNVPVERRCVLIGHARADIAPDKDIKGFLLDISAGFRHRPSQEKGPSKGAILIR
jgi:hypothetical protein